MAETRVCRTVGLDLCMGDWLGIAGEADQAIEWLRDRVCACTPIEIALALGADKLGAESMIASLNVYWEEVRADYVASLTRVIKDDAVVERKIKDVLWMYDQIIGLPFKDVAVTMLPWLPEDQKPGFNTDGVVMYSLDGDWLNMDWVLAKLIERRDDPNDKARG